MPNEKMSIETMFKLKQKILEGKLELLLDHTLSTGDHREQVWIKFFESFLPNKYAVDKGRAFDAKGFRSDVIDVIIYDALYTPLIYESEAGEKYITAESIYAVFESKPKIDKDSIEYTNNKVASVVNLSRSSRGMINAGSIVPPRNLTHIIGGILAIDSIEEDTIKNHLENNPYVDIGCAIKKTSFMAYRNEHYSIQDVRFSSQEESVIAFFYFILDHLYLLGTVAGIDIRDYSDKTIKSTKLMRGKV